MAEVTTVVTLDFSPDSPEVGAFLQAKTELERAKRVATRLERDSYDAKQDLLRANAAYEKAAGVLAEATTAAVLKAVSDVPAKSP